MVLIRNKTPSQTTCVHSRTLRLMLGIPDRCKHHHPRHRNRWCEVRHQSHVGHKLSISFEVSSRYMILWRNWEECGTIQLVFLSKPLILWVVLATFSEPQTPRTMAAYGSFQNSGSPNIHSRALTIRTPTRTTRTKISVSGYETSSEDSIHIQTNMFYHIYIYIHIIYICIYTCVYIYMYI